jgi:hypothetical protein
VPLPTSPTPSAKKNSDEESNLITAVKSTIDSSTVPKSSSNIPKIDELAEFPALPPKIKSLTEDSKKDIKNIVSADTTAQIQDNTQMEENEDVPMRDFVKIFAKNCSFD